MKTSDEMLTHYLRIDAERFLSHVVHDVRVPLSNIISATRLIQTALDEDEHIDKAQMNDLLAMIVQSTDSMRDLLDVVVQVERIRCSTPEHK